MSLYVKKCNIYGQNNVNLSPKFFDVLYSPIGFELMSGVKDFWPNFRRNILSVLSINLTLFVIETQNFKFRSITGTVLAKSKKKNWKLFLEPDAFLTKQYRRNWRACNTICILHKNIDNSDKKFPWLIKLSQYQFLSNP